MKRIPLIVASALTLLASGAAAQERLGGDAPIPSYRAGWTITPTFGVAETYDDNISLFGIGTAEEQNNDYVATYFPELDVHFAGKHTQFGSGYTGSFLDYRTYSTLNRWDQRARLDFRREESAQLKWFAHGNMALVPSTDLVDLGGIPFRRTGARTMNGRAGVEYALSARNAISTTADYQDIEFDREPALVAVLRGGQVFESLTAFRHKLNSRLAVGTDYSFRRAMIVGDSDVFNLHGTQAAFDYDLSPTWTLSGAGGVVYMQSTPTIDGHLGPAYRISVERHRAGRTFHVGYLRSYIPSFGFGGTVQNQQANVGFRTPLFGSRHLYFDASGVFRDDEPLTDTRDQLPLRSLRTYAIVGWQPQPWVRLEGFYARVQQTSLRVGGQIYRNRIGFQIVTSKPMRVQ
jgi:hypothetical protein